MVIKFYQGPITNQLTNLIKIKSDSNLQMYLSKMLKVKTWKITNMWTNGHEISCLCGIIFVEKNASYKFI